jgi:hypothetical protein
MLHLAHMIAFAGLVSVFFGFLQAPRGRRGMYALKLFGLLVGLAFILGLVMAPIS